MRSFDRARNAHLLARLIHEQIDRMAGMMPQQMVRPGARLARRVHVRAAKEIRLHVHLKHLQFPGLDLLVNVLMARIETPRVPAHTNDAGFLLRLQQHVRVG